MRQEKNRTDYLLQKIFFTIGVISIYVIGRCIPLYGLDLSEYAYTSLDAQDILMQTIGGDAFRTSVFALGIAPYMSASILITTVLTVHNVGTHTVVSPRKQSKYTMLLALIFSLLQAFWHAQGISFVSVGAPLWIKKLLVVLELVTGVMIIIGLASQNRKYGVGGQTVIFLVNIIDSMGRMVRGHSVKELCIPIIIGMFGIVVTLIFEGAQKQIPVQRVSIQNIYSDKNYIAIKMNPIGVMPIMFSAALFSVPQFLVWILYDIFPQNIILKTMQQEMVLTRPLGIIIYQVIIYLLGIGFSFLMINPKNMAEQLKKRGDSIVDIHPGSDTYTYLAGSVVSIGFWSSTMLGLCVGIPLFLQVNGNVDQTLMMFPTSCIMFTGMWYGIYQEIKSIRSYERIEKSELIERILGEVEN